MELSVGIKVAARGLEWDVTEVESLGPQRRVRLACQGGDLAGLEWDVLYPAETLTVLRTDPQPEEAGSLADWRRYHIARLLERVPGAPAPPGRVAIEAYQRVPLLRALDMVRPRLLLADGVGLGKTIQAGLIAAELLVRRRAHRILIVCPPGPLLRQWEQEMRIRFGLRFTPIADSAGLRDARRGLELGGNPFDATALCLTSIDFAKSDSVLAELERVAWDLVIIDEAHHCAGDDNQRGRLAGVLADRSDGLLLLTATPHDGHDPHFATLIALLSRLRELDQRIGVRFAIATDSQRCGMSGKSPVSASEEQRSGLAVLAGSRDRGEADRARAILLTLSGWTSPHIAEAFGVREDTVRLWRGDFSRDGVAALKASIAPGPAPVKTETALRVVTPLLEEPVANRPNWTIARMRAEIAAREGVCISRSQLSKALRKKSSRYRRPRHTLKGRQVVSEVERIGLRLQLREQAGQGRRHHSALWR